MIEIEKYSKIFKALSDSNRLLIINLLKDKEKCACDLLEEIHISQSTLSHHMKLLCDVGLVKCRKDGKWSHYSLSDKKIKELVEFTNGLKEKVEESTS